MWGESLANSVSVTVSKPSSTPFRRESSVAKTNSESASPEPRTQNQLSALSRLDVPIDGGSGPPLVLLHGFAMRPATYGRLAELLAARCRVVVPDLFDVAGQWRFGKVVDTLTATLDDLGLERISLLGHSFGGGIALGFASLHPERVTEFVVSDSLASSREWQLAHEVLRRPVRLLRLATPTAAAAFVRTWIDHPRQLVDAAWWGFTSGRATSAEGVARAGIPAHVLWANRDSILSRPDGEKFADELHASFTVAAAPDGRSLDHDWMFQQPEVFFDHLNALGLQALGG
jgi:pimeloyl-ACP methyl ester carboxylesterase